MFDDEQEDALEVDLEGSTETADEPAVDADTLMEMPDAPSEWDDGGAPADAGPKGVAEERAQQAADAGAAAAAGDSGD